MKKFILCLIVVVGCTLNAKAQFNFFKQGVATEKKEYQILLTPALLSGIDSIVVKASLADPDKLDYRKVYTEAEIKKSRGIFGIFNARFRICIARRKRG